MGWTKDVCGAWLSAGWSGGYVAFGDVHDLDFMWIELDEPGKTARKLLELRGSLHCGQVCPASLIRCMCVRACYGEDSASESFAGVDF